MEESLIKAAEQGNIKDLYELIEGDGNILTRNIDEVEFANTPLHIAASLGCIDFAMEIMNLKPSFSRKLNQQGLSPIHLAIKGGHKEMVLQFLEADKDLVRVRGKEGKTILHYISEKGNEDGLLDKILKASPECVRDTTTENKTALHIAVEHEKLDVLKILIRAIKKTEYYQELVNRKDRDGNTVLHVAVLRNEPQILKLLLKSEADKYLTNQDGKTALDVAKANQKTESIHILHGCSIIRVSTWYYDLKKKILKQVTRPSSIIFHDMDNISSNDRNALLVVLGLLLTATYQASVSPPDQLSESEENASGTFNFLLFYIPTCAVFMVSFFLTMALLKPYPRGFRTALQVLLAFLAICFGVAISFITPTDIADHVIKIISVIIFIILMFMCIAYRVSRISISILGCWFMSAGLFSYVGGTSIITLFGLFHFLHDEFWKATVIAIGYCAFVTGAQWSGIVTLLGWWFFLGFCRFCIRKRHFFYNKWWSIKTR